MKNPKNKDNYIYVSWENKRGTSVEYLIVKGCSKYYKITLFRKRKNKRITKLSSWRWCKFPISISIHVNTSKNISKESLIRIKKNTIRQILNHHINYLRVCGIDWLPKRIESLI